VATARVLEPIDILEDRALGLTARVPTITPDQLGLDGFEERLDRLYAAKVFLQSDAATANSEALRQVVDELADVEVERHRAADVDGETERGQVH
jgi:hypothetical protein